MTDLNQELLKALIELRSATIQFRFAAYRAESNLRVSNETVNMLSASLKMAETAIDNVSKNLQPAWISEANF